MGWNGGGVKMDPERKIDAKEMIKWEGEGKDSDLLYCVCVCGHTDGIYIPLLGYVSLNTPCIPLVVSCPVQSGHFNTLIAEA